jgi:hypothetical protein
MASAGLGYGSHNLLSTRFGRCVSLLTAESAALSLIHVHCLFETSGGVILLLFVIVPRFIFFLFHTFSFFLYA